MSANENEYKIAKFKGGRGDDFALWKMRVKALLIGKECWDVTDQLAQPVEGDTTTAIATRKAKAVMLIVNALGDNHLRVVMQESTDDPRKCGGS